jgi:nucleoid DNA-binding protein
MTITKAEIAERLTQHGLKDGKEFLAKFIAALKDSLTRGESVSIDDFGKFIVNDKKARVGRNPTTGAPLALPARRVVKFHPSKTLRTALVVKL